MGLLNALQHRDGGDGGGGSPTPQWPFDTAAIDDPARGAGAGPDEVEVCYWLTRLKRHHGATHETTKKFVLCVIV
jgi:hypothetical protein